MHLVSTLLKFRQVKSRSERRVSGLPESRSKVGQKYRNPCTFVDLLLTYFQDTPKPTFGPTSDLLEFPGFSGPDKGSKTQSPRTGVLPRGPKVGTPAI